MILNVLELAVSALGLFSAGVLKGVTGIGYSTCALPFLVMAVGLQRAMAIIIIPAIVSNISLMWCSGRIVPALTRFWRFYAAIIPGIALGAVLLREIDAHFAVQLLGAATLSYVAIAVIRPDFSLSPTLERMFAVPAGLANGVLTGLTGSQVMPLMPYMMALKLSAPEQVQAINFAVVLASVTLGGALISAGHVSWDIIAISAIGAVPAIVGVEAGSFVRSRLSMQCFRHATLAVLAIMGVVMVAQLRAPSSTFCARTSLGSSTASGGPTLSKGECTSRY